MKRISKKEQLLAIVESIIEVACELMGDSARKGGYYCRRSASGRILLCERIGKVPAVKDQKYHDFSREKGRRLNANPTHVSSWQTRDRKTEKWGGAVRLRDNVIDSFSGFPEKWDEACMLTLGALTIGLDADDPRFKEIVTISKNRFAARLLREVCRRCLPF